MIVELDIRDIVIPQGLLPRIITGTVEAKVKEYAEAMEEGVEFDPISVWQRDNGEYWVIDGVHRLTASKEIGKKTIKAKLIKCKDELDYRMKAIEANLKHGLPLQKQEKVLLAQTLYQQGIKEVEIQKLFGISDRTLRGWLSSLKEEKRENLKQKAKQLYYEEGKSLRQVAEELGVPRSTILDWLNEEVSENGKDCQNRTPHEEEGITELVIELNEEEEEEVDWDATGWNDDEEEEKEKEKITEKKETKKEEKLPLTPSEFIASRREAILAYLVEIEFHFGIEKAIEVLEELLEGFKTRKIHDDTIYKDRRAEYIFKRQRGKL